jgi:BASS family bile acid:Na+ symporter
MQMVLWVVLAAMIFAVSLDLKREDFAYVAAHPRGVAAGLTAQFILLPIATWGATLTLDLPAPVEAAMILVACCPGGALSNVITHFAGGNLALSVSISAISNVLALFATPLNFAWMIASNPQTAAWAKSIAVNPMDLVVSLVLLLGVPLALAMLVRARSPALARRLRTPLEKVAVICLFALIIAAVASQFKSFLVALSTVLVWVVAHNGMGLALGMLTSRALRLPPADFRAVTVESGMQNSGLAMGIIGAQFAADPQMITVAALWGIWHVVSGGGLALFWRRQDKLKGNARA